MEVILLENIRRLGKIGDVVKVKDGYGRNFLLPREKALRATEPNKAVFAEKRAEIEKENADKFKAAEKLAGKLEGTIVTMIRQAGEDGRLFGSVTANDIAKAVAEAKKVEITRSHVQLNNPIKSIGIQPVSLQLHSDLAIEVHVNVAQTEDEASDAKAKFLRGEYTGPQKKAAEEESPAAEAAPATENAEAAAASSEGEAA